MRRYVSSHDYWWCCLTLYIQIAALLPRKTESERNKTAKKCAAAEVALESIENELPKTRFKQKKKNKDRGDKKDMAGDPASLFSLSSSQAGSPMTRISASSNSMEVQPDVDTQNHGGAEVCLYLHFKFIMTVTWLPAACDDEATSYLLFLWVGSKQCWRGTRCARWQALPMPSWETQDIDNHQEDERLSKWYPFSLVFGI